MPQIATLSAIYIYPVKSCRGISLASAALDFWGLHYDRNWMVVDANGRFLTQREEPRLALVETLLEPGSLRLKAPESEDLVISLLPAVHAEVAVRVWRDDCQAKDQGEEAASWFSHYLQRPCRLVRMGEQFIRGVDPVYARRPAQVSFADGYPLLLISEASLADLNQRLATPLPMNRFRPNLVVSGCEPYAEDGWKAVQIGAVGFDLVKPCARCAITATDQVTTVRGKEPLQTLATYRRGEEGVNFGQNVIHQSQGSVRVGDPVVLVS